MKEDSYKSLSSMYEQMFELCDVVHCNSELAREVYQQHLPKVENYAVRAITHSAVEDNRVERKYENKTLKLVFVGNASTYKGFDMLICVLGELLFEGVKNWELDVWGSAPVSLTELSELDSDEILIKRVKFRGSFVADELSRVFNEDCLLVVPSLWNETFNLCTLEALSFGSPALVSQTVGAKDIIAEYDKSFVFVDRADLKQKLATLIQDHTALVEFNKRIREQEWKHSIKDHSARIIELYQG